MIKDIKEITKGLIGNKITVQGWIKNHRKQKEFGFIDFFDGTIQKTLQIIYNNTLENFDDIQKLKIGSALTVSGTLVQSPKPDQEYELEMETIILEGDSTDDYPIQPKRHSMEFLREVAYLRPRTNLFQAIFRVRSTVAQGIHQYFKEKGYVYFHAPIITGSDCEGAGEMFKVTSLDLNNLPRKNKEIDYNQDFFGKQSSLTVSGQLQAETFALAFKKVYTFGPTFRAEKSHTKTHASEFWMIEPEIAFADLNDLMNIEEEFMKYLIEYTLDNCKEEMDLFNKFVEPGLIEKLQNVITNNPVRITHKEAIDILINSNIKFENKPIHGEDLATEHEKYLTETHFKKPVFIYNWPKGIKAFYMRMNDDNETVAAVDLLVPGAGELMGGSQREERYDNLINRMQQMNINTEELYWYINLRKYGGCKHAGFGMGFERLIMYLTGTQNIRDVIPYPRTPNNLEF